MPTSIPEGWHSVTPRLVAHDPAKLVRFLKDAFGASGEFVATAPSVMKIGDSILMVSAVGPRGSLLIYSADTVHRGAEFSLPNAGRFFFKDAGVNSVAEITDSRRGKASP